MNKQILTLATVLMIAVPNMIISAAEIKPIEYDKITVKNGYVTFYDNESERSASHTIGSLDITVVIDEAKDMCVRFSEKDGTYRNYTLGKQTELTVSGVLESLTILNSNDDKIIPNIVIPSDGSIINTLTASATGLVEVRGNVNTLNVTSQKQAVTITGKVNVLNVAAANYISVESKAIIGARNIADSKTQIKTFRMVV